MRLRIIQLLSLKSVQIALIIVIAVATYLPILNNKYAYDDPSFFQEWTTPRSFDNVSKFIEGDTPADHAGVYRPFRTFIYAVDYSLWGENPVGYHAQSIVLNALIAVCVYLIVSRLKTPEYTPFVTGLLFAVIPAHTEAISFTTASIDSWGMFFGLAAIYMYLRSSSNKNFTYYLSIFLSICAYLTYELTLIVPVLLIYHRYIFVARKNAIEHRGKRGLMWLMATTLYYVFMRIFVASSVQAGTSFSYLYPYNILTSYKFYYQYLIALIYPFRLSVYHQIYNNIGTFTNLPGSLTSQPIIDVNFIASTVVLGIMAYTWYRTRHTHPIVAFSVGWYAISLLPVMNIIPTRTLFAERYVYFASFGYALILGYLLTCNIKNIKIRNIFSPTVRAAIITVIVGSWIYATAHRNTQWYNNYTLWTEVTQSAPWSPVGWNGLGLWYDDNHKPREAEKYYKIANSRDTSFTLLHANLARLYFNHAAMQDALREINLALKYDPKNPAYIADKLKIQNKIKDNPLDLRQSDSIDTSTHIRTLANEGNLQEALRVSEIAIKKHPHDSVLLNDAAVIALQLKQYQTGIKYLLEAQQAAPSDPDIYLNLANAFIASGQYSRAKASLRLAIELKPDFQAAKELLSTLH